MAETASPTRCGFVALIGAPNAGKSTLLNAVVGSKVTIVSHKVQTTRALIRGIAVVDQSQLIFVDTPGIFVPKRRLDRAMVTTAWTGAHDADLVVPHLGGHEAAHLVLEDVIHVEAQLDLRQGTCVGGIALIDARKGLDEEAENILGRLGDVRQSKALALNKIDLVAKPDLLKLAEKANAKAKFETTFMLSALTGDGVEDLKRWLAERVPPGPWLYPADQMSDAPLRQLAAEITREKLFERLHQELPYHSTVETDSWKELRGGAVRIEQTIYVERESQRKIVLGKSGQSIKAIGAAARKDIAGIVEGAVHLFLFVKVREGWGEDPERYRAIGLEFPKE